MATATTTEISKTAALELLEAAGLTGLGKLALTRLTKKLVAVPDAIDDDVELSDTAEETLTALLDAAEEGAEVKVISDAAAKKKAPKPEPKKAKEEGPTEEELAAAEEEAYDDGAEYTDADEPEEPKAKKDTRVPKKPNKDKPKPKKDTGPSLEGVRLVMTRPHCAGVVLAKHGLAKGITNEMVEEVDELFNADRPDGEKKQNITESRFVIRNAYHAIRGYLGDTDGAVVAGLTKAGSKKVAATAKGLA